MSQRLNVADLKADSSRIAAALNVCPNDPRFLAWANEAEERMVNQGRWLGTVAEVQFCIDYTGCFTLPREVATLERIKINGYPVEVVNGWRTYTRLLGGASHGCSGCRNHSGTCGHLMMEEREATQASFARTQGLQSVLRVYPGGVEDVGKTLTFYGYDKNNIWVRTGSGANVHEGELVTLAMPFVDTVTQWATGSPLAVTKDLTSWRVLVYEYDAATTAETPIAEYEPGETRPMYRVCYIPGLRHTTGGCNCTVATGTGKRTLTALASLQHVPLAGDGDWLLLQNMAAYKSAMIAVKAWEEGDGAKGNYYFYGSEAPSRNGRGVLRVVNRGGAIPLLQAELRKATGDRTNAAITVDYDDKYARTMLGFR